MQLNKERISSHVPATLSKDYSIKTVLVSKNFVSTMKSGMNYTLSSNFMWCFYLWRHNNSSNIHTINRLSHQIQKYMDIVTSNYYWHAKVSTICLIKRCKFISCYTLNVALWKWPKIDKAKQVDNIKNASKSLKVRMMKSCI